MSDDIVIVDYKDLLVEPNSSLVADKQIQDLIGKAFGSKSSNSVGVSDNYIFLMVFYYYIFIDNPNPNNLFFVSTLQLHFVHISQILAIRGIPGFVEAKECMLPMAHKLAHLK